MVRKGAGRPGSLEEARELIALVSGLSEAGDALTAAAVSDRLGISRERAERLLDLVLTAAGTSGTGLPLIEDGDELTLVFSQGMRGRRLRLTREETLALMAALDRLGVPEGDDLLSRLEQSLAREAVDKDLIERLVGAEQGTGVSDVISECSGALARREGVSFLYRKSSDSPARMRRVIPLGLRHENDCWYLDALDPKSGGERTFRLDRMDKVERIPQPQPPSARSSTSREVEITLSDPRYLELLPWNKIGHIERNESDGSVRMRTEYYGGMWLPRMIAACGGTAWTSDQAVNDLARRYAREQLAIRATRATC